ncbi:MAG: GNAT family N-acetyltransferase [Campylobacterales bacterium]
MSHKKLSKHKLVIRHLKREDFAAIKRIMDPIYPNMGGGWTKAQFASQLSRFPEGQIGIEYDDELVAASMSLIVDYKAYGDLHTYDQITGGGFIKNHDPKGDTLYGIEIVVDPSKRGLRLGRRLYDARKNLCQQLNLRRMIVGGRMPGYHLYRDKMSPQRYIEMVRRKEIHDPVLSFQLTNDFHVRRVVTGYLRGDRESGEFATLLEWINIDYEEPTVEVAPSKTTVRVGVVQWQMRTVASFEELQAQIEYFVDTVSGYNADFVLFPEFFNAPLMALSSKDSEAESEAIRYLARFTDMLVEKLTDLAVSYNINIIAGSMPVYRHKKLYNVSFLCRRDGTVERQQKLHITPDESSYWGVQGGDELRVFETDCGKIGILICYDVEFPELARRLADEGMEILFVPYWTDTKNAYLRVRLCAQARAIENECYVAISGSMGNLPNVENMDIQYAQSAVFTPSDFAFPHDAIAAEATPNTEMLLVADLDMTLLKEIRAKGSVRNLASRRRDLYSVEWLRKTPE